MRARHLKSWRWERISDCNRTISLCSTRDMQYNEEEGTVRMYLRGRPVILYVPTSMMESYDLHKVSTPPQSKLKLDWVYGYRGRDCRSNLHLLPTGEIVYFVAAVVVLYNMEEHSQRHYLGHTDDVKWWVRNWVTSSFLAKESAIMIKCLNNKTIQLLIILVSIKL